MPIDHTEKGFEQATEDHLLYHGYRNGDPAKFDASLALDPELLVEFLSTTQKDEWKRFSALYGSETGKKIVETIARNLEQRGMLSNAKGMLLIALVN